MKLSLLLGIGALALSSVTAQTAPQPAPAEPATDPVVDTEMRAMMEKIRNKLSTGVRTEDALKDELKEFDAFLAEHKGEKSDSVARANFMRAMLYLQVFQDYDKASKLFEQMRIDFLGLPAATAADEMLAKIKEQQASLSTFAGLKPGTTFPDFAEKDVAGHPMSVSQYKGKIVLVDFWATWCGPCRAELPNVIAAYQKYHDRGFEIVGISLDDNESQLKSFVTEHKMQWQQYFDGKRWNNKLSRKYGIESIPASFLLDREGKIVATDLRGDDLDTQLAKLLPKS